MHSNSVIGWGTVRFEEEFDKKVEALNVMMKHYTNRTFSYGDPAVKNVKIWIVALEEVTCKEFGVSYKNKHQDMNV